MFERGLRVVAVLLFTSLPAMAQTTYRVTHLAGAPALFGYEDGQGSSACFQRPAKITAGPLGSLYVVDGANLTVRRITLDGNVSTLAGVAGTQGFGDVSVTDPAFYAPGGIAVDSGGTVFVTDYHSIRRISGLSVTTFAGVIDQAGTANGTGTNARFNYPAGIAFGPDGSLYVADASNHAIRKVSPAGVVTTFAGQPGTSGTADGDAATARFNYPAAVAVDAAGYVYVADSYNYAIRKITPAGVVSTLAGLPGIEAWSSGPPYDGTGTGARFHNVMALTLDASGNVYVAESGGADSVIRKVTPAGVVTTLAGERGAEGFQNGAGPAAHFQWPRGITLASDGNLYVSDMGNNAVRRVTLGGVVTTIAGGPQCGAIGGTADGGRLTARFRSPDDVAVDAAGNVYVADTKNYTIRKITPAGQTSTLAGLAGTPGTADGTGTAARFQEPLAVAIGGDGNLYVADGYYPSAIRKVTPSGVVTTRATSPAIYSLSNLTFDASGTLYVVSAECRPSCVAKVAADGTITAIAGTLTYPTPQDGQGSAATFRRPSGIAVAQDGTIYVTDDGSRFGLVRKVTQQGLVTTIAGSTTGSWWDGTGSAAKFWGPKDLALGPDGNLYLTDVFCCNGYGQHSEIIRKVTPAGVVTTEVGQPESGFDNSDCKHNDGFGYHTAVLPRALFCFANGLTVDSAGRIYIADTGNHQIRLASPVDSFDFAPASVQGYVGGQSALTAQPGNATSWSWSVIRRQSGSSASLVTPDQSTARFAPDAPGRFDFELAATSPGGVTITNTKMLARACTPPTATVTGGATLCGSGSAQISVALTGTAPWTLVWSDGFVQNNVSTASLKRTATPSISTTYSIVSLSDATCPGIASGSATIKVISAAIQSAASSCVRSANVASVADAGSGATYSWSITGGSILSGAATRTVAYTASAIGTVTLSATVVAPGCNVSATRDVAVASCSCADINGDGAITVADVFHLINSLFAGGAAPAGCADANGDGGVSAADVVYVVNYLFAGGAIPH